MRKLKIKVVKQDAWTELRLGDIISVDGHHFFLTHKWMFSLNSCPHCGNDKTFHSERQMTGFRENVYDGLTKFYVGGKERAIFKKDLCLLCGRDWVFQIFCWRMHPREVKDYDVERKKLIDKRLKDDKND